MRGMDVRKPRSGLRFKNVVSVSAKLVDVRQDSCVLGGHQEVQLFHFVHPRKDVCSFGFAPHVWFFPGDVRESTFILATAVFGSPSPVFGCCVGPQVVIAADNGF